MHSVPSKDEVTHANIIYHRELAGTYDERHEFSHPRVVEYLHKILERDIFANLADIREPRVIDFGCGTGYMEQFFERVTNDVTGVDVSPEMLAIAVKRFPNFQFIEHDIYSYDAGTELYDIVIERALFHHLKEYIPVLEKMIAACKPGGFLFLGYEPNQVAFRLLAPLRTLYRRLFPEKRVVDVNTELGTSRYEAIAEYHQFYEKGISVSFMKDHLIRAGFRNIRVYFPTISFLAQLYDRTGFPFVDYFSFLKLGYLNTNFHITAQKG